MIPPSKIPENIKTNAYEILEKLQTTENQTDEFSFMDYSHKSLKRFYSNVENSARRARDDGDYEKCATLYVLVAELLQMVSSLSKNKDIVIMAKSSEQIWRAESR